MQELNWASYKELPNSAMVGNLDCSAIDWVVRFNWRGPGVNGSLIDYTVTGELRQIYHTAAGTTVDLRSQDGNLEQFALDSDQRITLMEPK